MGKISLSVYTKGYYEEIFDFGRRKNKANSKPISNGTRAFCLWRKRLPRPFGPPKEIDGFYSGRIEIAAVAALLRNDIRIFAPLCLSGFVANELI